MISKNSTEKMLDNLLELSLKIKEVMVNLNPSLFRSELTLNQLSALHVICVNPDITLKELAKKLNIAQSTASELVDRLVKLKYVTRKISPYDRRKIVLNISSKGKSLHDSHIDESKSFYRKLFSKLTKQEQKDYLTSMQKFYKISLEILKQTEEESK